MTWQPIETAPKDGTAVLLAGGKLPACCFDWSYWSDDKSRQHVTWAEDDLPADTLTLPVRARWRTERWRGDPDGGYWHVCSYDSGVCSIDYDNPTHWMPLPAFP